MQRRELFLFAKKCNSLNDVFKDHDLASLGDAYINFAYSLALSVRKGKPSATKVKGALLAEALKKAGLREYAPSRTSSHDLADAAEALIVYAWLQKYVTLEDTVSTIANAEKPTDGLTLLLQKIKSKVKFPSKPS
ncbi:MAG: ribonuclease III family protein [Candidatus Bathyarchaeia archaeon]